MRSITDLRTQIKQRYSHLFVESDDKDVQHLYWIISLIFAKFDGLVSPTEVLNLEKLEHSGETTSAYLAPIEQRNHLYVRLEFLRKYRIKTPEEILRLLRVPLIAKKKLPASDRKYLVEFMNNPCKPFSWYSSKLNVSLSSVLRANRRLSKYGSFRPYNGLNYPLFKLRHFALFYKSNHIFDHSALARPFTLSLNSDTFGDWRWASFLVPDQDRIVREFKAGLTRLNGEAFSDYRLYEIKSFARSCNLSMFDGIRWFSSVEGLGIGAFRFAESNKNISPCLPEFVYADKPIRFDQVDFLLACRICSDPRTKNSELRIILNEYNHVLSGATVSRRIGLLRERGAFFPYSFFQGLGLSVMLCFAIECTDDIVETFYHMLALFPDCYAYRSDKGVIFNVKTTSEMAATVYYLMQTLRDKVRNLISITRYENLGTRALDTMADYWNSDRQYWDFKRGQYDLSKTAEP